MNKKKSLYLTSGVLGLTTAALFGVNATSAQASSKGTVNYQGGATTVWDSPTVGQKPQSYLQRGQSVTIQATKQVYHQTWYQIGTNQWVSSQYITPASEDTQPAAPVQPASKAPAATPVGTITINYQGGATTVWSQPNFRQHTGKYLPYGTIVAVINQKTVNGAVWYQLADQGWVPAEYATFNQAQTTATQPVAATTTDTAGSNAVADSNPAPAASAAQPAANTPAAATPSTTAATPAATAPVQSAANTGAAAAQPATTASSTTTAAVNTNQNGTSVASSTATNNNAAETVVAAALSQVGTPYVWGGATPGQGLDCSGLVQYAYGRANVSLSHYTVAQESAGRQVSLSDLQPGDIIFWGGVGASYHDAIYIGNGQYVHAPQPGETVKVASISQYFMPSFAVRVF
ncbi:C40 family peptidase [Lactobacillus mellis]|uniref:C40 family peptidase n=1 Tax=Bombilactobacillus mellis TaxID=1218508 RepID=UPI0015800B19|nr:C40 family peptidase [Bombilactobacillus mellis]NUG66969.1 C40 family peptidase [Bombilactobacillus mellis]